MKFSLTLCLIANLLLAVACIQQGEVTPRGGMQVGPQGDSGPTPVPGDTPIITQPVSTTYVYRVNTALETISRGSVDLNSGEIVEHPPVKTGVGEKPVSMVIHPNKDFCYVANFGSNTISLFSIDQTNGDLIWVADLPTFHQPSKLAMDPKGRYLFTLHADNSQVTTHKINNTTGVLTYSSAISVSGPGARAIDVDAQGEFLVANSEKFFRSYSISQSTGALTYSGQERELSFGALKFHPTIDSVLGPSATVATVWGYDLDTGTAVLADGTNSTPHKNYPYSMLRFSSSGLFAYMTNVIANTVEAYTVSINNNGYLTYLGEVKLPTGCHPLTFDLAASGKYGYVGCGKAIGKTVAVMVLSNGTIAATGKVSTFSGAFISQVVTLTL